jgi:glycerophosphoryl diester phosphodiesterase
MLAGLVGTRAALDALERQAVVSVQAHRGLVGPEAPENSLAAFRAALAAGADTVETDVQLSRDGVPALVHDRDLMRLAGRPLRIAATDWAALAAVPLAGGQRLARLEELLELARASGLRVNLELKYYPGDDRDRLAGVAVAAIRAAGLADRVGIQSLELEPLRTVQRLAPDVEVGYLLSLNARDPWTLAVDWLAVEQRRISPALVRRAHRRGVRVLAWTVDDEADMVRLVDLGVDGLITDRPDLARRVVDRSVQAAAGRELARLRALLGA